LFKFEKNKLYNINNIKMNLYNVNTPPFFFWKSTSPLSNWHPSPFIDEYGNKFPTNEHYMMWRKAILFKDTEIAELILKQPDPKTVKSLGRRVHNFDSVIWNQHAQDIVYEGCMLKFTQNTHIIPYILKTKDSLIAEASPYDKIWGIGLNMYDAAHTPQKNWPGTNLLGIVLMKVRSKLQV